MEQAFSLPWFSMDLWHGDRLPMEGGKDTLRPGLCECE